MNTRDVKLGSRLVWRPVAVALSALLLIACGGGDDDEQAESESSTTADGGSDAGSDAGSDSGSTEEAGDVPDACSLLDVEEISAAIGREVGPGEPESTPEDASTCRFATLPGLSTSTTYDDPVIPQTALGSVTISTSRSSSEEFDEFQELLGEDTEDVSGVGDDAYFWGDDLIYVRVASRGLSVRVTADDADDEAVRAAVLRLAELGASKL